MLSQHLPAEESSIASAETLVSEVSLFICHLFSYPNILPNLRPFKLTVSWCAYLKGSDHQVMTVNKGSDATGPRAAGGSISLASRLVSFVAYLCNALVLSGSCSA